MSDRDPILYEREKTHGSFARNAQLSQNFKQLIKNANCDLCDVHKEALDMICLKISRILSGKTNERDHWDDIAGYAKLASEACDGQKPNHP